MKRVYIGMSGGVDSSVAALLLKNQGYSVTGFTMNLWKENKEIDDAKAVCAKIGIAHEVIDLKEVFKEKVVGYFLNEYKCGRTPNPCVTCNKHIKFGVMLDYIKDKADFIATGHYARVIYNEQTKRYCFKIGKDCKKDQTYMFYTFSQEQISKIIMPLGEYTKDEVREIAVLNDFIVANKPDSQDICFLEGMELEKFIKINAPNQLKKGNIVDGSGNVLGKHEGISCYTIGQRRGLGVASEKRIYVTAIDCEKNQVVLDDESHLFTNVLYANNVNFLPFEKLQEPMQLQAKIRYAAKPVNAIISNTKDGVKVEFESAVRAVTPGQSVVFYKDDILVGGGIIMPA